MLAHFFIRPLSLRTEHATRSILVENSQAHFDDSLNVRRPEVGVGVTLQSTASLLIVAISPSFQCQLSPPSTFLDRLHHHHFRPDFVTLFRLVFQSTLDGRATIFVYI
jgi:hypothetical protein